MKISQIMVKCSILERKKLLVLNVHVYCMQALHDQGHANADHTTLLLNCYTKLKNVECLDSFVKVPECVCICACVYWPSCLVDQFDTIILYAVV